MVRQDKTAFAEKLIVFFGLLGALLYAIGTMWDVHIHVYYGHSQLAPPHLTVGAGILLYVFVGLILAPLGLRGKRVLGTERKGLVIIILFAVVLVLGIFFHEMWHLLFGKDMTAWSPPHVGILLSVMGILFGFTVREAAGISPKPYRWPLWSRIRGIIFLASLFFVTLFFFIDFDAPGLTQLVTPTRPGFSYAGSLIGMMVFLSLLTGKVTRRAGVATLVTLIAWGYYTSVGIVIGVIGFAGEDPNMVLPPLPIVVPALAVDLLFFFLLKKQSFPLSTFASRGVALVAALICYGCLIAWVELYTRLPQQGPQWPMMWLVWLPLILIIALCAEVAASLFVRWALGGGVQRSEV